MIAQAIMLGFFLILFVAPVVHIAWLDFNGKIKPFD